MVNSGSVVAFVLCAFAAFSAPVLSAESISGAGSSAAAPVYKIWASEYAKVEGTTLDYAAVGSGAGMTKIYKHEVDFGASDVIASAADLKKNDLVMFPTVITGVVPVINVGKIGPLPNMYEHLWFTEKVVTLVAQTVATASAGPSWPASSKRSIWRAGSQTRTRPSTPAEASHRPSGEYASASDPADRPESV